MDFAADSLAVCCLWIGVFSLINNLATWTAAVVAAATFSFWKYRTSSPCSFRPIEDAASEERLAQTVESPSAAAEAEAEGDASPVLAPATTATDMMVFGTTKGKVTVFFGDFHEDEDGGGKDGGGDDGEGAAGEWWWSGLERVARVRRGETEWYSCQDVTFINGNVVRLWDDVRTSLLPLSYVVC